MAITVTPDLMTSDLTFHAATRVGTDNGWERWRVSWLSRWEVSRNQATTAMILAEHVRRSAPGITWPLVNSLASELGLTGAEAFNLIRLTSDEVPDGNQSI